MRLQVPATSELIAEFSLDKQGRRAIEVSTRGGELVTTLYVTNILNHTGDLLLDSASDLVLDAETVEAIKDRLNHQQARVDAKRASTAKTYKTRAPKEEV
jgi:hypothetical protein